LIYFIIFNWNDYNWNLNSNGKNVQPNQRSNYAEDLLNSVSEEDFPLTSKKAITAGYIKQSFTNVYIYQSDLRWDKKCHRQEGEAQSTNGFQYGLTEKIGYEKEQKAVSTKEEEFITAMVKRIHRTDPNRFIQASTATITKADLEDKSHANQNPSWVRETTVSDWGVSEQQIDPIISKEQKYAELTDPRHDHPLFHVLCSSSIFGKK